MTNPKERPIAATTGAVKKKEGKCLHCGKPIDLTECYWRRFCDDACRNKYNVEAARLGREILKEQRTKAS